MFFPKDELDKLRQLSRSASDEEITVAASATLKLSVWVHQKANGNPFLCLIQALGRQYTHIRSHNPAQSTLLSALFEFNFQQDVSDTNIQINVKEAGRDLDYPASKWMLVKGINTHSLCR